MAELINYFGIDFFDIVSESSKRRFRRVFRADEIAKISNKLAQDLTQVLPKTHNQK